MVAAKPARGRQQRPLLLLAELAELLINVATQVEHRRASAAMMLSIVPHHTGLPQDMLTPAFVSGSGFVASMSKGDRAEPRQRLDKVTVCGAMRRGSTAGVSGLAQHRRDRHRGEVEGRRWEEAPREAPRGQSLPPASWLYLDHLLSLQRCSV